MGSGFPPGIWDPIHWLADVGNAESYNENRAAASNLKKAGYVQHPPKKVLLVDHDDTRRKTRVRMLREAGYEVQCRNDHEIAEALDHEGTFDLLILALHRKRLDEAAAYSERLRQEKPTLPILLILDAGVFVPRGTLSASMDAGFPVEMMRKIAEALVGSSHIREVHIPGDAADADSAKPLGT